jgi:hypothetical protein
MLNQVRSEARTTPKRLNSLSGRIEDDDERIRIAFYGIIQILEKSPRWRV